MWNCPTISSLNRAIALAQKDGPERGLEAIRAIEDADRLADYPFLPAALGVYMLTNSVLGITQQLAVEKLAARAGVPRVPPGGKGDSVGKTNDKGKKDDSSFKREQGATAPAALRKGKARV